MFDKRNYARAFDNAYVEKKLSRSNYTKFVTHYLEEIKRDANIEELSIAITAGILLDINKNSLFQDTKKNEKSLDTLKKKIKASRDDPFTVAILKSCNKTEEELNKLKLSELQNICNPKPVIDYFKGQISKDKILKDELLQIVASLKIAS